MGLDVAANWTQIASFVVPIVVACLGWIGKRWVEQVVREMSNKMEERTRPIQATANGGWSLPDAIRLLQKLDSNVTEMQKDLSHLKGRFDNHIEEN